MNSELKEEGKKKKKKSRRRPSPQEQQARARVKALLDVDRKKSIHVTLQSPLHREFKKYALDEGMTMQNLIEIFVANLVGHHPALEKLVQDYKEGKRTQKVKELEAKYLENLFDVISDNVQHESLKNGQD